MPGLWRLMVAQLKNDCAPLLCKITMDNRGIKWGKSPYLGDTNDLNQS